MTQDLRLSFAVEPWQQYYPECVELWDMHYAEFTPFHRGRLHGGPDVAAYKRCDAAGQLMIVAARAGGKLVGYALVVIRPHLHYKATLCGFEDAYYLHPDFRRGMAGVKLIKFTIQALRARGVKMTYWMTKEFINRAKLLERLGMEKCDTAYCLWLGD